MLRILKTLSGALLGLTELEEIGIDDCFEFSDYVFCPRDDAHVLVDTANIVTDPV